jgi:hypothetical protein
VSSASSHDQASLSFSLLMVSGSSIVYRVPSQRLYDPENTAICMKKELAGRGNPCCFGKAVHYFRGDVFPRNSCALFLLPEVAF